MDTIGIKSLNSSQLEILKLFSREMSETDMLAIKRLIVDYLNSKITMAADEAWDEKNWSDNEVEKILKSQKRTKYNPEN